MTCVVGISTPGKGALIGFDSLAGGNGVYKIRRDPKGAKLTPWLALGYTTSFRFGQILTHYLEYKTAPADPYEWAIRDLVPQMRKLLGEHGWLTKNSEQEQGGDVLLAVRDRILVVHSDFQVAEAAQGWSAIGSGEHHAAGALYATRDKTPRTSARTALEAAENASTTVRRPWHFLETKA